MKQGKAFEIPKALVWQAYLEMRKNKGALGCDGQTMTQFDEQRDRNLYKLWNRLSSGSYLPPPVREKRIPKTDGSERTLGISRVSDRVAQGVAKIYLERRLEPLFHNSSFGYRPGRSAHDALAQCEQNCRYKSWALEVDINAFFDHVSHDLIVKALKHHQIPAWVILYCQRWMQALTGELRDRQEGTPQEGVISPLLANLFLHYAFDKWMVRIRDYLHMGNYYVHQMCDEEPYDGRLSRTVL